MFNKQKQAFLKNSLGVFILVLYKENWLTGFKNNT